MSDSVWATLSAINANDFARSKGDFSYLSWAWAWGILKKNFPNSSYEKHLFERDGHMAPYMADAKGNAFVQVTVTVEGQKITEILPVLGFNNKPVQNPDAFEVNKALQRCLAKAIAMHGLGHYIYAGEDLPSLDDLAKEITLAIVEDDANRVEFLYSQRSDEEKAILWKAKSKGGFFGQSEKEYIRTTGYKIVNEDVTNDLLEVMAENSLEWPHVEGLLTNFYSDDRGESRFDIEALPIGYARQAMKMIKDAA